MINAIEVPPYELKVKIMTIIIYELALRISEALRLTWDSFNWLVWLQNKEEYGVVTIKNTKRGKSRIIPVHPTLMKLLYENHKLRNEQGIPIGSIVFNYGIEQFFDKSKTVEQNQFLYLVHSYNYYMHIIQKLGKQVLNKRIRPHQLRHGKAQSLLDSGYVTIDSLKLLLGHESIRTTEIYAQSSTAKLLKELKSLDNSKNIK